MIKDENRATPADIQRLKELMTKTRGEPGSTASRVRNREITPKEGFVELCKSFPAVRHRIFHNVTAANFDALQIFNSPDIGKLSSGEYRVMQFLASVWNPNHSFECGPFDFQKFMDCDPGNRAAFIAWVTDPWWP